MEDVVIRNKVSIERQINERLYQFLVPFEAPLDEVSLIVDDIKKYVEERIRMASEEVKAKQNSETNSEG